MLLLLDETQAAVTAAAQSAPRVAAASRVTAAAPSLRNEMRETQPAAATAGATGGYFQTSVSTSSGTGSGGQSVTTGKAYYYIYLSICLSIYLYIGIGILLYTICVREKKRYGERRTERDDR